MNNKALSPLVGLALILASVVSVVAIYQTQTVPALLKEQEWGHYLLVKEKFESLSEKAELAAKSGGFVVVNFPLKLKYEGFSFAPLISSTGCNIKAEKIGNITIIYEKSNLSFEIVALKLIPKYNYLKADDEIFVLGSYFTSDGKPLKISDREKLIILDTNFDEISGNERLTFKVLPLIGSPSGSVNVIVNSTENWLLDYLRNEFNAKNISQNTVSFNSTSIEFVIASISKNVENKLKDGQLSIEDLTFNVSLISGGATFEYDEEEQESSNIVVRNDEEIELNFIDPTIDSVILYITGYTSYFNENVNITIKYIGEDDEVLFSQKFVWSTLSNGYLQIPIKVFNPDKNEIKHHKKHHSEEEYKIDVILTFGEEKEFKFSIEVKKEDTCANKKHKKNT